MTISKSFDYFTTIHYNKNEFGKAMNEFLRKNHCVKEIILSIFVPAGAGETVHKNRSSHGLALNSDGEKKFVFSDGTVLCVGKNDFIYLPKNSTYTVQHIVHGGMYCINFQCVDDENFKPFVLRVKNVDEVQKAYQKAEKAWRYQKSGTQLCCKAELYKILYELYKQSESPYIPETKRNLLKPAIDYIHKKYTEELINVEDLSKMCGISYEYFRRLFYQFYGCSPVKYINNLKITRARELLASGLYTVSDAAIQSGFVDLSHFSRFFKKNEGVSPSEYINKVTIKQ